MPSERIQRRIEALLDEADLAVSADDWPLVANKARAVLAMDPANEDAPLLLKAAEANLGSVDTQANEATARARQARH
jgi:hypothetical protein